MMLVNQTDTPLTLNHQGRRVCLPPTLLMTLDGAMAEVVRDAAQNKRFFKCLLEGGKVLLSDGADSGAKKARAEKARLKALAEPQKASSPEAPISLWADAERNGRKSRLDKFVPDGEMAV